MATLTRRALLAGLGAAPLIGGLLAWRNEHNQKVSRPREDARKRLQRNHLPNVELVNQDGKQVRFYDDLVKDKKVVINFMYSNCKDGTCPLTTANLTAVQGLLGNRVGQEIFFYSITLKPDEDSPAVLKDYMKHHHVGLGWQFLTGRPDDIERLRRALGFTWIDPAEDADKDNHVGMVRYGTEAQMFWGAAQGMANPEHLLRILSWEFDRPSSGGRVTLA